MDTKIICPKCKGKGVLMDYQHIAGGKCFCCNGSGYIYEDNLVIYCATSSITSLRPESEGLLFL